MLSFILHHWCTDLLAFSSTCWKKHINTSISPLYLINYFMNIYNLGLYLSFMYSKSFFFASYIHIYDIQMAIKLNWTAVNTCSNYRLYLDGRNFCYFLLIDRMRAYRPIRALFYLFKVNFSGNVFGFYDHLPSKLV